MTHDSEKNPKTDNYLKEYHEKLRGQRDFTASSQHMHKQIMGSGELKDSHDKIRRGFDHLKHEFSQKLNQLQDNFVTQYEQYWDVKQKVDSESKRLEDIYRIRSSAEGLKDFELSLIRKRDTLDKQFLENENAYKIRELAIETSFNEKSLKLENQFSSEKEKLELRHKSDILATENELSNFKDQMEIEKSKQEELHSTLSKETLLLKTQLEEDLSLFKENMALKKQELHDAMASERLFLESSFKEQEASNFEKKKVLDDQIILLSASLEEKRIQFDDRQAEFSKALELKKQELDVEQSEVQGNIELLKSKFEEERKQYETIAQQEKSIFDSEHIKLQELIESERSNWANEREKIKVTFDHENHIRTEEKNKLESQSNDLNATLVLQKDELEKTQFLLDSLKEKYEKEKVAIESTISEEMHGLEEKKSAFQESIELEKSILEKELIEKRNILETELNDKRQEVEKEKIAITEVIDAEKKRLDFELHAEKEILEKERNSHLVEQDKRRKELEIEQLQFKKQQEAELGQLVEEKKRIQNGIDLEKESVVQLKQSTEIDIKKLREEWDYEKKEKIKDMEEKVSFMMMQKDQLSSEIKALKEQNLRFQSQAEWESHESNLQRESQDQLIKQKDSFEVKTTRLQKENQALENTVSTLQNQLAVQEQKTIADFFNVADSNPVSENSQEKQRTVSALEKQLNDKESENTQLNARLKRLESQYTQLISKGESDNGTLLDDEPKILRSLRQLR
jgi:hypothetical protein